MDIFMTMVMIFGTSVFLFIISIIIGLIYANKGKFYYERKMNRVAYFILLIGMIDAFLIFVYLMYDLF